MTGRGSLGQWRDGLGMPGRKCSRKRDRTMGRAGKMQPRCYRELPEWGRSSRDRTVGATCTQMGMGLWGRHPPGDKVVEVFTYPQAGGPSSVFSPDHRALDRKGQLYRPQGSHT